MEHYKAQNAANLAQYEAERSRSLESFRSVILTGQAALKSAILINGGASVALLAFLGHIWNTEPPAPVVAGLTQSLLFFLIGVLLSAMAAGTTYLTQAFYDGGWDKTGMGINFINILLVVSAYYLYLKGGLAAYSTFVLHLGN